MESAAKGKEALRSRNILLPNARDELRRFAALAQTIG
jgi:hypothetical protein